MQWLTDTQDAVVQLRHQSGGCHGRGLGHSQPPTHNISTRRREQTIHRLIAKYMILEWDLCWLFLCTLTWTQSEIQMLTADGHHTTQVHTQKNPNIHCYKNKTITTKKTPKRSDVTCGLV